jgi:hypothetical protein
MTTKKREWSAVNRFSKRGPLKGCWLKDPDGKTVATIMDGTLAIQIAAAMNLTTQAQRINWNTTRAGYTKTASAMAEFEAAGLRLVGVMKKGAIGRILKRRKIASKDIVGAERKTRR